MCCLVCEDFFRLSFHWQSARTCCARVERTVLRCLSALWMETPPANSLNIKVKIYTKIPFRFSFAFLCFLVVLFLGRFNVRLCGGNAFVHSIKHNSVAGFISMPLMGWIDRPTGQATTELPQSCEVLLCHSHLDHV